MPRQEHDVIVGEADKAERVTLAHWGPSRGRTAGRVRPRTPVVHANQLASDLFRLFNRAGSRFPGNAAREPLSKCIADDPVASQASAAQARGDHVSNASPTAVLARRRRLGAV